MEESTSCDAHVRHNLIREPAAWIIPLIKLFVDIFPGHFILHSAHLFHMFPFTMASFMTMTMITFVVHVINLCLAGFVERNFVTKIYHLVLCLFGFSLINRLIKEVQDYESNNSLYNFILDHNHVASIFNYIKIEDQLNL